MQNVAITDPQAQVDALIGERLTLEAFSQLAGNLAGYPFVKVVVDRVRNEIHFINHARYPFHADYIAEKLMGMPIPELERRIDEFNHAVYLSPDRKFYLGILSLHKRGDRRFFSLETVEIDNMNAEMLKSFYGFVKAHLDRSLPLVFKPANHLQETFVAEIDPRELPRTYSHELFATSSFVPLNAGATKGRIRSFKTPSDFHRALPTIEWHDIVVMHRVPDSIPRVSGIINAHHTTPLSHTNVLAAGWGIPNCTQIGIFDWIQKEGLEGQWVEYGVETNASQVFLRKIERPEEVSTRPAWSVHQIKLEAPETERTPIVDLSALRVSDRHRYGTKAANLGELLHVLNFGSERLVGFYRVERPPRPNLLPYLYTFLGKHVHVAEEADLSRAAWEFLKTTIQVPRGIAIPFSIQQEFLESSPRIQQTIGKLKMAIELNSREIASLCVNLQQMIKTARMPEKVRSYIDSMIARHLAGVSSFVVRSSSNAEDLRNFSAAGIYESINHVTSAENIFQSIKEVWGSLLSPRSVRLRSEVGISLDDCYMGVIVQEEVPASLGGVLVTTNPMNRSGDFRNVYINVSSRSVNDVVQGLELPYQYLFNTVEGGGRTLSLGSATEDLNYNQKVMLQKLAFVGRLLQAHFSPDYLFRAPVDIEWAAHCEKLSVLQLRPYA